MRRYKNVDQGGNMHFKTLRKNKKNIKKSNRRFRENYR